MAKTETFCTHKESWYQSRILRWLRTTYPDAFVWKAAAGAYSQGGIPDVCAIICGKFYAFEVKRPDNGRLSKLQTETISKINQAGGFAFVVHGVEEVRAILESAQDIKTMDKRRE